MILVFIYLCKRSVRDCVIKLRDNRLIKALPGIKKSFKYIDFDLAKHGLVFKVNHRWNLFEKFQILKFQMSLLGIRSTSNILTRKRV